jgi:hypothetical protein
MWYCNKIGRECLYFKECNNVNNISNINNDFSKQFSRLNIKEILLKLKIKKVWKLEWLKINELEEKINLYKNKYIYWVYTFNDYINIIWQKIENKSFILLLSYKNKYIQSYTSFDNSLKDYDRVVLTGMLLGYSKCCSTKHFKVINNLEDAIKSDNDFDKDIFIYWIKCKLLNPFLRLYVHIPCSNICKNTIDNSEKVLKYLEWIYWDNIINYFFNVVR